MNWESLSVVLAVIGFFGAFTSVIAWLETRADAARLARFAPRYDDYVVNQAVRQAIAQPAE